jgi:hypothetical protein
MRLMEILIQFTGIINFILDFLNFTGSKNNLSAIQKFKKNLEKLEQKFKILLVISNFLF